MNNKNKVILHIDIDTFFLSVEKIFNPTINDKYPVAVAKKGKLSVILTSNYSARKLGIKSGLPLFKAYSIYPKIRIIEPHYNIYKDYSKSFFEIMRKYSPIIEIISVDECFLDVTII